MFKKTFLTSIVCGLLAILSQPMSVAAATPSLAGSWQITLTPITTPIPTVSIFGLATFTTDGSVVETDSSEVIPGLASTDAATYGTPGHGIWQVLPSLSNLYVQYISLTVNADGSLQSKNITTASVALNQTGNGFNGNYTKTESSTSGQTTTTSGKITGQLIPHPLLP